MTEIIKNFPPFKISPISKQIEQKIIGMDKDEFLSYEELESLTGLDCRSYGKGYIYLNRTRRRLEKNGHHSKIIPGKGVLKLTASGALDYYRNQQDIKARQINRQNSAILTIEEKELTQLEQIEYRAVSLLGKLAGRVMTHNVRRKVFEEIKNNPQKQISYEDVVGAYMRGKA